jgi:hypothetical protein
MPVVARIALHPVKTVIVAVRALSVTGYRRLLVTFVFADMSFLPAGTRFFCALRVSTPPVHGAFKPLWQVCYGNLSG